MAFLKKPERPQHEGGDFSMVSNSTSGGDIVLEGVTKRFVTPTGQAMTAIRDVNIKIGAGKFCAIVGPTGCGKSTTLTLTSGLDTLSAGTIHVAGRPVMGITPGVGFVFQNDALLPWKSVIANVAFGPLMNGIPKAQAIEKAREWLATVGLTGFENHYPHQLSGGMRKRVQLAATLINDPSLLMMDEPFSALDVQTRAIMTNELMNLWEQSKPSVMFVTHDLEEAIAIADQVVVMTVGPATVKDVFEIDLPRPRGAIQDIRFQPRFLELYKLIWNSLREEVERSYAMAAAKRETA